MGADTMTKKNPYPTLAEMGVESPKQIDKYYISSINLIDVLRIVYHRPEGSLLPSSRTYNFPRVQGGAGSENEPAVLSTHPVLRAARACALRSKRSPANSPGPDVTPGVRRAPP